MIFQVPLNPVPEVRLDDRRVLALMHAPLVGNLADVDRVRQHLIDVASAETPAPGRSSRAIDADWNSKVLGFQGLLEPDHAAELEITPKQASHDLGVFFDN